VNRSQLEGSSSESIVYRVLKAGIVSVFWLLVKAEFSPLLIVGVFSRALRLKLINLN